MCAVRLRGGAMGRRELMLVQILLGTFRTATSRAGHGWEGGKNFNLTKETIKYEH
ncbi:hypothetical protein GALMADRAFT_257248 [Galerina marginata CBS 339.88]|uniref:Uncharacterized protein n=1 Tax=Galerina marginata (strain CBS 339.88) TaxID=685588 RepID=A0A067SKH3_GALM3|nr:hypothetical protein GALMADRAFT_257248 [Galerina marginata CBS 339.88]